MDNSTEQAPAFEYTAQVSSPLINEEAKIAIGEKGLMITTLFDALEVPYADTFSIALDDYVVKIETQSGSFSFAKLGNWCEPFYLAVITAYYAEVLKALFISGDPIATAKGDFSYSEDPSNSVVCTGTASFFVMENCICILPPTINARRIPLSFVVGMNKEGYKTTVTLDSGASYSFSKLGYDTEPFNTAIEKQIRALREKSLASITELDPSLDSMLASKIAKVMPAGAAVRLGLLNSIAPTFVCAIEKQIEESRAAETYKAFKEISDPSQIYVGFIKNVDGDEIGEGGDFPGGDGEGEAEEISPDPYQFWMIVPSGDGKTCAFEFAGDPGESAATYIYRCENGFDAFARTLNYSLESNSYKRDVIRLTEEDIQKPENSIYRMSVQRNISLKAVRASFAGRAIHRSIASWKKSVLDYFNGNNRDAEKKDVFCRECGEKTTSDMKFCGKCGAKMS